MTHGTDQHDDSLDDLFGGTATPRPQVNRAPADFVPAVERLITEPCSKCRGSGWWRQGYPCFTCKGSGKRTFKTSADHRAKARANTTARKLSKRAEQVATYTAANPDIALWLATASARNNSFAVSLLEKLNQWGELTEGQATAVRKAIAADAERATQRTAAAAAAPTVDTAGIDRLKEAFDHAVKYSAEKGLKLSPRITIGGVTISPAKATSANAGALYVKAGGEYLGKIKDGRFLTVAACTPELQTKVLAFIADPADAAKVYGQTTGTCCICNATLISKWKLRGIGPICAEKFGW
jgi:hypothetical protein